MTDHRSHAMRKASEYCMLVDEAKEHLDARKSFVTGLLKGNGDCMEQNIRIIDAERLDLQSVVLSIMYQKTPPHHDEARPTWRARLWMLTVTAIVIACSVVLSQRYGAFPTDGHAFLEPAYDDAYQEYATEEDLQRQQLCVRRRLLERLWDAVLTTWTARPGP